MSIKYIAPLALFASLAFGTSASALTITEASGNLGSLGIVIDEIAHTVELREVWDAGTAGTIRLRFTDLTPEVNWVVTKYVTNNTGADWVAFGHELLHDDGSPSPDNDGLSFAQGSGIPRTSDSFANLFVDELGTRDYLNWTTGTIANGATGIFSYGLRDNDGANNPFLLEQTANVPEPATWALLIAGFGMVGVALRRRSAAITA